MILVDNQEFPHFWHPTFRFGHGTGSKKLKISPIGHGWQKKTKNTHKTVKCYSRTLSKGVQMSNWSHNLRSEPNKLDIVTIVMTNSMRVRNCFWYKNPSPHILLAFSFLCWQRASYSATVFLCHAKFRKAPHFKITSCNEYYECLLPHTDFIRCFFAQKKILPFKMGCIHVLVRDKSVRCCHVSTRRVNTGRLLTILLQC